MFHFIGRLAGYVVISIVVLAVMLHDSGWLIPVVIATGAICLGFSIRGYVLQQDRKYDNDRMLSRIYREQWDRNRAKADIHVLNKQLDSARSELRSLISDMRRR